MRGVRTIGVHNGALGQRVAISQAEDILFGIEIVLIFYRVFRAVRIRHLPGSHDFAGTERSTKTNQVGVGLEAVDDSRRRGGLLCVVARETSQVTVTQLDRKSTRLNSSH